MTNSGFVAPRIFMDDTAEDRKAIQSVLQQIMMYPLSEYDGKMKSVDWSTLPKLPNEASGEVEIKWVKPETFFDQLPAVLADAPRCLAKRRATRRCTPCRRPRRTIRN